MKNSTGILLLIVLIGLSITGCSIDTPDTRSGSQGAITYQLSPLGALVSAIDAATGSICLSLRYLPDPVLVTVLNSAAERGVNVRVVVDGSHTASASGLSPQVSLRSGNSGGRMNANFALIDDRSVLYSSPDLTNYLSIGIVIRHIEFNLVLSNEFEQMHTLNLFGTAKRAHDAWKQFRIGDHTVEMRILPYDRTGSASSGNVLEDVDAFIAQSRRSLRVFSDILQNETLNKRFLELSVSGLSNQYTVGNTGYPAVLGQPYLVGSLHNRILSNQLPCSLMLVDEGSQWESLLFSTFSFASNSILRQSDGITLIISSPRVGTLSSAITHNLRDLPGIGDPPAGVTVDPATIAVFNVLRLGDRDKYIVELARAMTNFDLIGLVEVQASVASNNDPWSYAACETTLTNATIEDLRKTLVQLTGEPWATHISPESGTGGGAEYYAYIWRTARVSYIRNFGLFPVGGTYFIRPPYGAQFEIGNMDFTLVLQHAHYGDGTTDPRREAGALHEVYTHFQSQDLGDRDVIIGGDFNLAADDSAFDPLYLLADNITWAIHPATPTTIGWYELSSPYDNIFYSRTYTTQVMELGRGAHASWLTGGIFNTYPSWSTLSPQNNYTFSREYISDHVPVYMTLNVSYDNHHR